LVTPDLTMFKRLLLLAFMAVLFIAACKKSDEGSKQPQITPVQGTIKADWGDTITIAGKNLPTDAKVFIGGTESDAVSSNIVSNDGSAIRCVVPVFIDAPTVSVFIQFDGQTTELTNYLTLNAPVISSFTNTQALGDTVVITGNHFSSYYNLQVNFGNATSTVSWISKKMLKAVVPDLIPHIHTSISVTSQLQTVASVDSFTVLKPVISSVTAHAFIGTTVTVTGKYFHPGGPYQIYLDGVLTPASVVSSQQITFTVPYKTYPQRKTLVELKLLEYDVPYSPDVNIEDNWIMVSQGVPFVAYYATALNVGSSVYVVAPAKPAGSSSDYLWRFNPSDFSWTQVGSQISVINGQYTVATDGTNIYLYNSLGSNSFYECDPTSGTWTERSNFPGIQRNNPEIFSIGGKIYLGGGADYVNNNQQYTNDCYAYTPGTDSWNRIADMQQSALNNYPPQSLVIGNTAYVLCGGWFFDYKYNPAANTWAPMQNMLEPRVQDGVLAYNNQIYTLKGYIVQNVGNDNRDIFNYNPASDQWRYIAGTTIDPYGGGELNFAFVTGGRIYMLSYDDSAVQDNLYEALTLP
jgi:N-acetylneuraminic acid mutarotase